jgi:hypothetical protein|uniref:Uncharacterized protein n=1 Tax=viral metagenome TaxID=1070528 RepID=A0A6C0CYS3_9ZZZZ
MQVISERNKINNRIRELTKYINTDENNLIEEINDQKIERLNLSIKSKKTELQLLEKRLIAVNNGEIDLNTTTTTPKIPVMSITTTTKADQDRSIKFMKADKDDAYKNKCYKKDVDRYYRYFLKDVDAIPEYITKNLANMPNNKGYYWKGMQLYGSLPAEVDKPVILFDKKNHNKMLIHEWDSNYIRLYEKEGKERKVLLSCEPRRVVT